MTIHQDNLTLEEIIDILLKNNIITERELQLIYNINSICEYPSPDNNILLNMYLYPPYQIPRYNMLMVEYILRNIYFCEIENRK